MHQALGAANCSTCKLTTLQRKVGRRLSSGCEPPSFSYGTGQSLGFLFTSSVVGRRVLVLSSGWLASYVGQSEVPALITSLFFLLSSRWLASWVSRRCLALIATIFFISFFVTTDLCVSPLLKPSLHGGRKLPFSPSFIPLPWKLKGALFFCLVGE